MADPLHIENIHLNELLKYNGKKETRSTPWWELQNSIVIPPIHSEDVSRLSASAPRSREGIISFHGNTDIAIDVGEIER